MSPDHHRPLPTHISTHNDLRLTQPCAYLGSPRGFVSPCKANNRWTVTPGRGCAESSPASSVLFPDVTYWKNPRKIREWRMTIARGLCIRADALPPVKSRRVCSPTLSRLERGNLGKIPDSSVSSAVNGQVCPGNVCGRRTGYKGYQCRDFIHGAVAFECREGNLRRCPIT
jgi:hypothetical protein